MNSTELLSAVVIQNTDCKIDLAAKKILRFTKIKAKAMKTVKSNLQCKEIFILKCFVDKGKPFFLLQMLLM